MKVGDALGLREERWLSRPISPSFLGAFRAGGGNVSFVDAPAFGDDGHFLFSTKSADARTPYVDDFLRARKLLPQAPSSAAALPMPPQLGNNGKDAFAQFRDRARHKAFAVSPDGWFGWRAGMQTTQDATRAALDACSQYSQRCSVYAVDDALAR